MSSIEASLPGLMLFYSYERLRDCITLCVLFMLSSTSSLPPADWVIDHGLSTSHFFSLVDKDGVTMRTYNSSYSYTWYSLISQ